MASDNTPPRRPSPSRYSRWPPPTPSPARPYRLVVRLLGVPAVAVIALFLYRGLHDYFVLPECDSQTATKTLSQVLGPLKLEPTRYQPIKTISRSDDQVVCNAVLPLPDGANVAVDYSFYWQGNKATMKYSVVRKPS